MSQFNQREQTVQKQINIGKQYNISHPLPVTGIASNLRQSGVKRFVGRDFKVIDTALGECRCAALTAIHGMGGVGKTEFALQYALHNQTRYRGGLCWVDAAQGDLANEIVAFARAHLALAPPDGLTIEGQLGYCWSHWPGTEAVLIIFDDVADLAAIRPVLAPPNGRFSTLVTTRLEPPSPFVPVEVEVLAPDAALELLGSLAGADRCQHESKQAADLCERLGYLPLAIELVGRHLAKHKDLKISQLIDSLAQNGLADRALAETDSLMTARRSMAPPSN